jgi:hypothetical protein
MKPAVQLVHTDDPDKLYFPAAQIAVIALMAPTDGQMKPAEQFCAPSQHRHREHPSTLHTPHHKWSQISAVRSDNNHPRHFSTRQLTRHHTNPAAL